MEDRPGREARDLTHGGSVSTHGPFPRSFTTDIVRAVRSLICPLLSLGLLSACAGGTPDGQPPPFRADQVLETRVLTGPEGVQVRIAQTEDAALVEMTRVRDGLDGVVLLTELGGSTAERSYLTQLNGRQSRLMVRKNRDWILYLGGSVRLDIDEEASKALAAGDLIDRHVHQRAEGRLAALARFDDVGARKRASESLQEEMARLEKDCGFAPTARIDYAGLTEAQLMKYSLASYCGSPRSAIERACKASDETKSFMAKSAKQFVCKFGSELGLSVEGDALVYTVDFDTPNQAQWSREALDRLELEPGRTVHTARMQAQTLVCTAEGGQAVVVGPDEAGERAGVSYGNKDKLYRQPERRYLPEGWFFEPRYPNPGHNENFRGYDLRIFSFIGVDDEKACQLRCGPREVQLQKLEGADKRAFLEAASFEPIPDPREPYALARDKRGRYYYVDRGATPETAKDFHLYIGPQGRLKQQKMKDIVSDSEGEIFASSGGRLKLFLGKERAEWLTRGKRSKDLVRVDVWKNLDLIYNRLGVYLGQPLHNPCDDL